MGFLPIEADPCVFLRQQDGSLILAYVNDIIFIMRTFGKDKCCDLAPISHYLGICIWRARPARLIKLSMKPYINKLI
jgi:hypothetical protein